MGVVFTVFLCFISIFSIILPDTTISQKERRHLQQFPIPNMETVLSGNYFAKLESYMLDQFPFRDSFRSLKTQFDLSVIQKKDADGYFQIGEVLYELPSEPNSKNILQCSQHFEHIMTKYFPKSTGFFCMIPDKTYYLPTDSTHIRSDYDAFAEYYQKSSNSMLQPIEIKNDLTINHYYKTDMHLKQETLSEIAHHIGTSMTGVKKPLSLYEERLISDSFYGGISSASGLYPSPDNLVVLSSQEIANAIVFDYESKQEIPMYNADFASQLDPYDVYLGGAKALLKITNSSSKCNKELVLFRDSFGSALAPLLLEYYDTIYLIDLRYTTVHAALALITPSEECDVLFLYSTNVLNSGSLRMKVV